MTTLMQDPCHETARRMSEQESSPRYHLQTTCWVLVLLSAATRRLQPHCRVRSHSNHHLRMAMPSLTTIPHTFLESIRACCRSAKILLQHLQLLVALPSLHHRRVEVRQPMGPKHIRGVLQMSKQPRHPQPKLRRLILTRHSPE